MKNLLELLVDWDFNTFKLINHDLSNTLCDAILPFLREPLFWSPLYLFLAVYMIYNFRLNGFYWCLFFILVFAFGDAISSSIIKPLVGRLRPCQDIRVMDYLVMRVECGRGLSFTSTHATNHFALATFMVLTLGQIVSFWSKFLLFFWAAIIAFSQVYVGVHFPLDVIGGGLLGIIIGSVVSYFYLHLFKYKISF